MNVPQRFPAHACAHDRYPPRFNPFAVVGSPGRRPLSASRAGGRSRIAAAGNGRPEPKGERRPAPPAVAALALSPAPTSEGARKLAWWIAADERRVERVVVAIGTAGLLDRIMEGAVVPGDQLGADIARATGGTASLKDWERPALGGWNDAPAGLEGAK